MRKAFAAVAAVGVAVLGLTGCTNPVQSGVVTKVWATVNPNPWLDSSDAYMLDVKLNSDGTTHTWSCYQASECDKLQVGDEIAFRVSVGNSDYIQGVKRSVQTPNR